MSTEREVIEKMNNRLKKRKKWQTRVLTRHIWRGLKYKEEIEKIKSHECVKHIEV